MWNIHILLAQYWVRTSSTWTGACFGMETIRQCRCFNSPLPS